MALGIPIYDMESLAVLTEVFLTGMAIVFGVTWAYGTFLHIII